MRRVAQRPSRQWTCLNLDDMSRGELAGLDESTLHPSQIAYVKHIYNAKSLRLLGHIDAAIDLEKRCQQIYLSMPSSLRW